MKHRLILILVCLFIALPIGIYQFSPYSILSIDDLRYAIIDNQRPALSFPDTGKKFFNEWDCFGSQSFQLTTTRIDYDGLKDIPTLFQHDKGRRIEFTIDPDVKWDVVKIMSRWKHLLHQSKSACLYSVHLQDGAEGEVRYIDRFKTDEGIWDRSDNGFILQ